MSGLINDLIHGNGNRLVCGIKLAIAGNLIAFAAKHKFDENSLKGTIENISGTELTIDEYYPTLQVFYGIRGKPIVNDVTIEDAREVCMEESSPGIKRSHLI